MSQIFEGAKQRQKLKHFILDMPLVRSANHTNKTICSKLLSKTHCKRKPYK